MKENESYKLYSIESLDKFEYPILSEYVKNSKLNCKFKKLKFFRVIRKKRRLYANPKYSQGRWSDSEHESFLTAIATIGKSDWKKVFFKSLINIHDYTD